MLVPDAPQPSLELVTVLFSPKAMLKGQQRLSASITICSQATYHMCPWTKSRCVSRQGALPFFKNPTEEHLRTQKTKVEPNRLVLQCLVQAPWCFSSEQQFLGTQKEGQGGEMWRIQISSCEDAPLSALCIMQYLGWCWGIPPSALADVMDGILRTEEPWLHSLDLNGARRPDDSGIWWAVYVCQDFFVCGIGDVREIRFSVFVYEWVITEWIGETVR